MNGIIKRLIGVLFISLFVFNMGVQTYAADDLPVRKTNLDKDVYFVVNKADEQEIREIQRSLENDYSAPGIVYNEKVYFGGVSNGVSDYFYNQLNSLQKEMYNNFDAEFVYDPVLTASQTADKSTMNIELKNASQYSEMWFLMWSDENGQDDAHWYYASKKYDGTWTYDASMTAYSTTGSYTVVAFTGYGSPTYGVAFCSAYAIIPIT